MLMKTPFPPHHQPGPSGNSSDILINLPPDSQGYVTPPGSFVSMGSSPQQESLLSDLPVTVSAPASGMASTQIHYLCLPNPTLLIALDTSQHPFLLPLLTEPRLQMICLICASGNTNFDKSVEFASHPALLLDLAYVPIFCSFRFPHSSMRIYLLPANLSLLLSKAAPRTGPISDTASE